MSEANPNSRLEAFCDGVFGIALTLLIVDIKLPPTASVANTTEAWRALEHLVPSVLAFLLSFSVILIAWVNHHAALKLMKRSSASFIYANGFLLLTVVFVPFPTALLGEFVLTDHAAPAVVLYDAVLAAQAIGWILMARAALKNKLARDEAATAEIRENGGHAYSALALYGGLAIVAFWFPLTCATITTVSWIFWLVRGYRMHDA